LKKNIYKNCVLLFPVDYRTQQADGRVVHRHWQSNDTRGTTTTVAPEPWLVDPRN